jgi:sugar transferase (PEP-CTERM system associated)
VWRAEQNIPSNVSIIEIHWQTENFKDDPMASGAPVFPAIQQELSEVIMFRIGNHFVSKSVVMLLVIEYLLFLASALGGRSLHAGKTYLAQGLSDPDFRKALLIALAMSVSMIATGMYQGGVRDGLRNILLRMLPAGLLSCALMVVLFDKGPPMTIDVGVVGLTFLLAGLAILCTRTIFFESMRSPLLRSRILFLGAGKAAIQCSTLASQSAFSDKYSIVGYVPTSGDCGAIGAGALIALDGDTLLDTAERHHVTEIVVSATNRRDGAMPIRELLECKLRGIKITDATELFERETCQIRIESLQPSWLVFGGGFDQSLARRFCKRTFDIAMSVLLFVVTLPIMLVTAACIALEDRGPVFYQQERVGKGGKTFMVLKFRSMRCDAEKGGTPQWASGDDPRTTRVGRFIRTFRIDELPQIINVINGEMSFVGPRPERPYFVEQLNERVPFYSVRHSIKPGITGMAQVRYAYGASVEDAIEKLQYDLYYVKNTSLFLDALILIDTMQVVLFGKGAR